MTCDMTHTAVQQPLLLHQPSQQKLLVPVKHVVYVTKHPSALGILL